MVCAEIQQTVCKAIDQHDTTVLNLRTSKTEVAKIRNDVVNIGEGILKALGFCAEMIHVGYELISRGKYGSKSREEREHKLLESLAPNSNTHRK